MSRADPAVYGRLALVCGGDSAEREISLRSGRAVDAALERLAIAHEVFDGPRQVVEAVCAGRVDTVLNMLHGGAGEDGRLQGALALFDVPVTGSGVLASALTMDKLQTKRVWRAVDLPTPDWCEVTDPAGTDAIVDALGLPVFVKPACEGSSVGTTRVMQACDLSEAIARAVMHGGSALVERMIQGPEFTASILDDKPLPLIRIATPREFYDFDAKYETDDTEYHCPCGLPGAREARLQAMALEAFNALGCSGWGRVDFLLDEDGSPWFLEVNTVPGMTDHSLVPMAAAAAGLDFDALVDRILQTAGGVRCDE